MAFGGAVRSGRRSPRYDSIMGKLHTKNEGLLYARRILYKCTLHCVLSNPDVVCLSWTIRDENLLKEKNKKKGFTKPQYGSRSKKKGKKKSSSFILTFFFYKFSPLSLENIFCTLCTCANFFGNGLTCQRNT